jgi:probable F420-dependent oxidoreductase
MRFVYAESMVDPSFYLPLAQAAEEAGFDAMVVPDSVCYPEHSDSRYPFNPDGSRDFLEGKPFIDPFVLASAIGAVTRVLSLVTFVLKLPIRHPVLVAKQATSAAVMTGGRFLLGVGISPWREDYEVTGSQWEGRGARMDEQLAILRGLSRGGYFEFHGRYYDVPSIRIDPVPADPLPVLIGGHSEAALRRAAATGDGWLHGGGDPAALPSLLARLAKLRSEAGRHEEPFSVYAISPDAYSLDGVARLEEMGVTDAIVGFRWPYSKGPDTESLSTKIDNMLRFSDSVIGKLR